MLIRLSDNSYGAMSISSNRLKVDIGWDMVCPSELARRDDGVPDFLVAVLFDRLRLSSGLDKGDAIMDDVGVRSVPSFERPEFPLLPLAFVEPDDADEAEMNDDDEDVFIR